MALVVYRAHLPEVYRVAASFAKLTTLAQATPLSASIIAVRKVHSCEGYVLAVPRAVEGCLEPAIVVWVSCE